MRSLASSVVLAAAIVLAWAPGVDGPYVFDDAITPLSDPASQSLSAFAHELPRTLRPITKLSYAIEADAGLTDHPGARRAVSLALLVGLAFLLRALLRTVVPDLGETHATIAAAIVALHPVMAESVLAIAGRSAVLGAIGVIGALLAMTRDRPRLAGGLLLAACLARETSVAAVVPLVVTAFAEGPRPRAEHWRRLAPVFAAVAIFAAWLAFTPRYRDLADYSFHDRPLAASMAAQVSAIPRGLSLYVRVDRLTLDHGERLASSFANPLFLLGVAVLAASVVGCFFALRARRYALATGLALWLAAIVPTQTFVPKIDALTERPLALALVGIVIAAAPVLRRRTALAVAIVISVCLGVATASRARLYCDELVLWQDAAAKSQTNARPFYNAAVHLERAKRYGEALTAMRRASELAPEDQQIRRAVARITEELK